MEKNTKHPVLDFDSWMQLAADNPQAFENERKALIEHFIEHNFSSQSRKRLRSLQWRIDTTRRYAPSPIAACLCLNKMMWNTFAGDYGLADTLKHPTHIQDRAFKPGKIVSLQRIRR